LTWNEPAAHWEVRTDRGDVLRAKSVISSIGLFPRAKLPAVEGIEVSVALLAAQALF
jgi:cation diffusion facilitator CzcD-associated flavoprotein CzcO